MSTLGRFLRWNTVFSALSIAILACGLIWSLLNIDALINNRAYAIVAPIMALMVGCPGLLIDQLMRAHLNKRKTVNLVQAALLGLLVIAAFVYRQTLLI